VVINLHRPAWDDFVVSTVHGGDTMRDALRGRSTRGTSGSSHSVHARARGHPLRRRRRL